MKWSQAVVAAVCALGGAVACQQAASDDIHNIPIQEYHPTSMLKTRVTQVPVAKYPAIDVHNHLRRLLDDPSAVDEAVRAMVATNAEALVNLDGGWGETLEKSIRQMNDRYPGRFIQFMRVDWSRYDEPDFGEAMAKQLENGYRMGARGLKISKVLGLRVRNKNGDLIRIDDPKLDPIWAKCGDLGIPVNIHISDPAAFFTPLDKKNERLEELMDHPDWAWYGPGIPDRESLLEQRNTVIARHPNTTFIGLHVGGAPEDLERVGAWLERYPNFNVETGARVSELGRQPYSARRFMIKYQDRVLFGTDSPPLPGAKAAEDGVAMFRIHWRFYESDDEYIDVTDTHHYQGRWRCYGLHLPDEVLEKFYNGNARRLIPGI